MRFTITLLLLSLSLHTIQAMDEELNDVRTLEPSSPKLTCSIPRIPFRDQTNTDFGNGISISCTKEEIVINRNGCPKAKIRKDQQYNKSDLFSDDLGYIYVIKGNNQPCILVGTADGKENYFFNIPADISLE